MEPQAALACLELCVGLCRALELAAACCDCWAKCAEDDGRGSRLLDDPDTEPPLVRGGARASGAPRPSEGPSRGSPLQLQPQPQPRVAPSAPAIQTPPPTYEQVVSDDTQLLFNPGALH